jgi:glycosyltransferase involved in cell wall biosynthesis
MLGYRLQSPLVSIVTPVHNGAAFIEECIESVVAQTHENWEYVVVDNASTDGTADLADRFAKVDPRVRVERNTEFVGVIQNWNRALRRISSESTYCKIVHADDTLLPECVEQMVDVAQHDASVGLVGAYRLFGEEVDLDGVVPWGASVVDGATLCRYQLLGGGYVFGSPTSLLVRSDLVRARDRFYDESIFRADAAVCYALLRETNFGFVHQVLTRTRLHDRSVTTRADRLGSWWPEHILILIEFGPQYLSSEEFPARLREMCRAYAAQVARNGGRLGFLRDPELRTYHREVINRIRAELGTIGYELPRSLRLASAAFLDLTPERRAGVEESAA